jgi:hypothetical protein
VKVALKDNVSDNYDTESDYGTLGLVAVKLLPIMFKLVTETHATASIHGKGQDHKESEGVEVEAKASSASSVSPMQSYQQLQTVTEAISSLARLAPKDFLYGLFKKVMHRLLEEIQSESGDSERIRQKLTR